MKQFHTETPSRRRARAITISQLAALALVITVISPAGAAPKISSGQELIYSGTAAWKISTTAGQSQTITGPIRFSALVSEADPAKGYSVILMRRFQQDTKTSPEQNQSDVELATVQFGPDLARTGSPDRPTGPISMVMQAIRLPFAPRAEVKPGQVWHQTEALPAMPPKLLEVIYTVGGEAKVGQRSGIKIEKKLAQTLPFKQDLNGRSVTLADYGETITVDPETGQVLGDQLHEKLEIAAGNQKLSLDLAAGATLEETHQLAPAELASRVKQAAVIEHLQTGLFTFRPGDEGKKILANAAKEAAAFRGQYASSPYAPALAHLEEIRTQIQAELDRQVPPPGQKRSP